MGVCFFNQFCPLCPQTCTAGLCSCCCSWGKTFRTRRWSWWTGPSRISPSRTACSCEYLTLVAPSSLHSAPVPAEVATGQKGGEERARGDGPPSGAVLSLYHMHPPPRPQPSRLLDFSRTILLSCFHTSLALRQGRTLTSGWSCMGPAWKRKEPWLVPPKGWPPNSAAP